ncbi:carcinoembryonic antigen-related cell adhesion molecule 8-like [Dendropsophus ebraccatus]|uniref:carcinoembryonic antigen-related cell adhesion molecule 8-like n=1 Tax=Dendropsophus ebraccatus TaxID=150705 RepID=UPI00383200D5
MVNETVILNVRGISGTLKNADWYKGQDTNAANQILKIDNVQKITNGPQFFPETTLFPNGSLKLKNVSAAHKGYYTVSVQADQLFQATTNLTLSDSFQEIRLVDAVTSVFTGLTSGLAAVACCRSN